MRSEVDAPAWFVKAVALSAALCAGAAMVVVLIIGSDRLTAVSIAGGLFVIAAFLSGNLRLSCLWGLMLTLPLSVGLRLSQYQERGGGENAIRIELCEVFLIALVFFLAHDVATGAIRRVRVPKLIWLWVAIMLLGTFTAFFGEFRWVAGLEVIRMFKVGVLFLVICNELRRRSTILHGAAALTVSMLVQATVGVVQYLRGGNLGLEVLGEAPEKTSEILAGNSVYGAEVWRVSGLVMHPNLFGIFLASLLPLAIGMFLVRRNGLMRMLYLVATVFGVVSLIATFSRSSWLSFAAAMATMLLLVFNHAELRRRVLVPLILAMVCMGAVGGAFSGKIVSRLVESKEQATTGREAFKEDARRLIAAKPIFGFGLNSYVDVVLPYSDFSRRSYPDWVPPVHHIYYLWWADTGIVGLTLHLAVFASVVLVGITNLRIRDPMMLAINVACLAAIVAFFVDGFLSFPLRTSSLLRLIWVQSGLIVAIYYWRLGGGDSYAQRSPSDPDDEIGELREQDPAVGGRFA